MIDLYSIVSAEFFFWSVIEWQTNNLTTFISYTEREKKKKTTIKPNFYTQSLEYLHKIEFSSTEKKKEKKNGQLTHKCI